MYTCRVFKKLEINKFLWMTEVNRFLEFSIITIQVYRILNLDFGF